MMTADTEPQSDETPVIEREPNDCRRCTGNGIEPGTVWPCAACYGTGKESIHPRGGVVSVSGTERGHDTRPGESRYAEFRRVMAFLEANDVRLVRGYGRDEDSIHFGGHRIGHLHDRYAEIPDVSR